MKGENVIAEKSKSFAIQIVKFYKFLCEEKKEFVISKQLLRSGTSIGANVRESKNAQSKPDFISKLSVALKEADETCFWLEIMLGGDIITQKEFDKIYADCEELVRILVSIIKSNKNIGKP